MIEFQFYLIIKGRGNVHYVWELYLKVFVSKIKGIHLIFLPLY